MAILTRQILQDLGIHLDDASYEMLEEHFETTLQERVIEEIIRELSNEQAEELAHMKVGETADEELYAWLVENVADLPEIVSDEVDILLGEVAKDSEKF